jgi:hypothetical protein
MQPLPSDSLTIAFLLDENVSELLIPLLALLGYDAVSVGRLGWKGHSDADQLLAAASLGRVVVTYDVDDYELLHLAWHAWAAAWNVTPLPTHPGILTIRSSKGLTAQDIASAIDGLMKQESKLTNRFFGWTVQRGWEEPR